MMCYYYFTCIIMYTCSIMYYYTCIIYIPCFGAAAKDKYHEWKNTPLQVPSSGFSRAFGFAVLLFLYLFWHVIHGRTQSTGMVILHNSVRKGAKWTASNYSTGQRASKFIPKSMNTVHGKLALPTLPGHPGAVQESEDLFILMTTSQLHATGTLPIYQILQLTQAQSGKASKQ